MFYNIIIIVVLPFPLHFWELVCGKNPSAFTTSQPFHREDKGNKFSHLGFSIYTIQTFGRSGYEIHAEILGALEKFTEKSKKMSRSALIHTQFAEIGDIE